MTPDTINSRIIERVRKMLALQAGATTEGEAAAAAARIQAVLVEHNLSMAQIDSTTPTSTGGVNRVKQTSAKSAMYEYQRRLMNTVADTSFCYHSISKEWRDDKRAPTGRRFVNVHRLIGREENVVSAQLLYEYLTDTMDRMLPWQGMQKRGKEALLWLDACSARLAERLTDRFREQERARKAAADANTEQGLVLLTDVYRSEQDDNADMASGREVGHTRKWRAQQAAEAYRLKTEAEALVNSGQYTEDEAWYVVRGFDIPTKCEASAPAPSTETPAQKRRREEREEREYQRRREARNRQWARELERQNHPAYRQGSEAAERIGLDAQIDGKAARAIGGTK